MPSEATNTKVANPQWGWEVNATLGSFWKTEASSDRTDTDGTGKKCSSFRKSVWSTALWTRSASVKRFWASSVLSIRPVKATGWKLTACMTSTFSTAKLMMSPTMSSFTVLTRVGTRQMDMFGFASRTDSMARIFMSSIGLPRTSLYISSSKPSNWRYIVCTPASTIAWVKPSSWAMRTPLVATWIWAKPSSWAALTASRKYGYTVGSPPANWTDGVGTGLFLLRVASISTTSSKVGSTM